jgi:hypothetical protein
MAGLRAILIALGVGAGIAAYATLWWHWPLAIGAGVGILLGGLALTGMVSIGPDSAAADAAWRVAAPDLVEKPAEPAEVAATARPEASRSRDIPSGD